ncbi:MAG: hypothetical protein J3K34DRAFT_419074 [Monoraphidium minutum]|nr:MAG: hypothetical protein J3K34DRAFT_419074 [Monoraphidium minutum]
MPPWAGAFPLLPRVPAAPRAACMPARNSHPCACAHERHRHRTSRPSCDGVNKSSANVRPRPVFSPVQHLWAPDTRALLPCSAASTRHQLARWRAVAGCLLLPARRQCAPNASSRPMDWFRSRAHARQDVLSIVAFTLLWRSTTPLPRGGWAAIGAVRRAVF